jgi:transcriptional regulator of nitric oxide reductase
MKVYWVILLVVVAGAVAAPWALSLRRRRGADTRTTVVQVIGFDLSSWTDSQLYAVWIATAGELRRAAQSDEAATAARARELLLSEIERRHPRQTATWLTSPEALTGEPPEFLVPKKNSN